MDDHQFTQRVDRAPEFAAGAWLNAAQPFMLSRLRGRAVLVHIWDYTSVHCLRTLPYIRHWHERYADLGLTVIGVHTPGFSFGRERRQVELSVQELNVRYPVLLDNEFRTWHAFNNRFWPARYLIDQHGYIRFRDYGEGGYAEFEQAIQVVLREIDADLELPPLMGPLREEDKTEGPLQRPTPELRGGFDQGALGNPEGYADRLPIIYRLPSRRLAGAFYVAGAWQAGREYLAYQGLSEGLIRLPYEAVEVNAVLSPHPEAVERILHPDAVSIEIYQDEQPIDDTRRGDDMTSDGRVIVSRPRVYNLVRNPKFEKHELTLRVHARGVAVYAFSFTGGAS